MLKISGMHLIGMLAGLLIATSAAPAAGTAVTAVTVVAAEPGQRTLEDCRKAYDACYAECRKKHPEQDLSGDAARTTCGSACAAQRTVCRAELEYREKAKPQLDQMIDQLKKMLDDFLKGLPGTTPPPESPQPAPEKKDDGPVKI
ncbi:MAG: hypothetical protein RIB59_17035 [Rhodospirillales bacterium]